MSYTELDLKKIPEVLLTQLWGKHELHSKSQISHCK